jgi:NAD(P)H-dependent flavin oxidoreductase YrpB (nitropropane dioxygenase family)
LLRHAASGVDLIVAQGTVAGGHTRELAATVLVRAVVNLEDARVFGHKIPNCGHLAQMMDISATVGASGLQCLP